MEQKEYPVPVFSAEGNSLEFIDSDGNPFNPSGSLKYSIIGEDGSTLKEGTLENTNTVSLEGVTAKSFRVILDSHFVVSVEGIETPDEEADSPVEQVDQLVIPPSVDDPDEEFQIVEDLEDVSSEGGLESGDQDGAGSDTDSSHSSGEEESEDGGESAPEEESTEGEESETDDQDSAEKTDSEEGDTEADSEDSGPQQEDGNEASEGQVGDEEESEDKDGEV